MHCRKIDFFFLSQSSFELSYSGKSGSVGTRGRDIALLLLFFPILLWGLKESVPVSDILSEAQSFPHTIYFVCTMVPLGSAVLSGESTFTQKVPTFWDQDQLISYKPTKQKTEGATVLLAEPQLTIKDCQDLLRFYCVFCILQLCRKVIIFSILYSAATSHRLLITSAISRAENLPGLTV